MRLLIYDIQDPIDPQVNGFGLYRSVVDGTENLLIERKEIPSPPEFTATHPWEAADCTNQELILIWPMASQQDFTLTAEEITDEITNPQPCTMTQIWEINPHLNSYDDEGYRATHPWEIEQFELTQPRMTWAFSSTMEDSALGSAVEFDNDPPVGNSLVESFQEHVFIAGDPNNPHYLYWSKRFEPESYPTDNFVEIGTAADPIKQIKAIAGVLGVFTRATKYRVSGNATSGFVHWEAISHRGTHSPKSVVASDKGLIFVANDGVFVTNLIGPDKKLSHKIEPLFTGDDLTEEEPINMDAAGEICGAYFKDKYWFSYPSGTSTENNKTAVYDFDMEEWTIYDFGSSSMLFEDDIIALTGGDNDGFLFLLESGTTDQGSEIEVETKTKWYEGTSHGVRSLFLYFKVDAKVPERDSLVASFYVDGELKRSVTMTGDRTKLLMPLPENTFGYRWQVQLTGASRTGELKIYDVATMFLPLGPA